MAYIKQIKLTDNVAYDLKAKAIVDAGDSSEITIARSKESLAADDYTQLAAWNGKELRAVDKSQFATEGHTHDYLPLKGGVMTGAIYFGADYSKYLQYDKTRGLCLLNAGSYVGTTDSGQIILTDAMGAKIEMNRYEVTCTSNAPTATTGKFNINFDELNVSGSIKTKNSVWLANTKYVRGYKKDATTVYDILGISSDDACYVGTNSCVTVLRGTSVKLKSTSGNTVTSDRNLKKDFIALGEKYDKFFDALNPLGYKYIFGTSDRTHCGFIAQEVEEALNKANLTTQEFGGIMIDEINSNNREVTEALDGTIVDVPKSETNYLLDNKITKEYGLKYEEFIGLLVDQVQKLKRRVDELENKN